MGTDEYGRLGRETAATRPVAIPDDFDRATDAKATGVIELPQRIRWSGPPRTYDLTDPQDRARVYEQVLREGTESDIRYYVQPSHLLALWDDLVLPGPARAAWERWFSAHGLDQSC